MQLEIINNNYNRSGTGRGGKAIQQILKRITIDTTTLYYFNIIIKMNSIMVEAFPAGDIAYHNIIVRAEYIPITVY